jgi:hypothetical protein
MWSNHQTQIFLPLSEACFVTAFVTWWAALWVSSTNFSSPKKLWAVWHFLLFITSEAGHIFWMSSKLANNWCLTSVLRLTCQFFRPCCTGSSFIVGPNAAWRTVIIVALQQPCPLFDVQSGDRMNCLFQKAASVLFFSWLCNLRCPLLRQHGAE